MKARKNNVNTMADNSTGLHFCINHNKKMAGMYSISTSVLKNKYCAERCKNKKTICSHCYAARMSKMFKGLEKKLSDNLDILTRSIIPVENMPIINAHSFRLEAFGDLNNTIQVINYFNLCRKNRDVNFAIWTKNPFIISNAIHNGYKKPANLIIIYSSPVVDENVNTTKLKKIYPFVDKVFTVYSSTEKAAEHGRKINCDQNNCLSCLKCYRKNKVTEINELLKI